MKRTKKKSISCKENLSQYLLNSTLHGLRYVGEANISYFERVFFILSIVIVLLLSAYFISNVWMKWSASPTIITFSAVSTTLSEFPFPAVTICNMNQAKRSAVRDIPKGSMNYSFLQNLCSRSDDVPANKKSIGKWFQFRQLILGVSQPCNEMLLMCRYGSEEYKCFEIFNSVLTDEGLCCSFNTVHPKFLLKRYNDSSEFGFKESDRHKANDWTPEKGFNQAAINTFPRSAVGPGSQLGLFLILNASLDDYFCSSTNSVGFKMLLHNPVETPKITDYGLSLSTGYETRIAVTPILSSASNLIQKVPQKTRQCVFENESNLTYFRTYSRKNCEMECESRIYERECNCVLYYMPRISEDVNICGNSDMICTMNIKRLLEQKYNSSYSCTCLPACFAIAYGAEISMAPIIPNGFGFHDSFLLENDLQKSIKDLAIVQIYFRGSSFRSQTKEELVGLTEFLSNTGGLLGLFMGFSFVSIIEIIYFATIRPYCANYRLNKQQNLEINKIITTWSQIHRTVHVHPTHQEIFRRNTSKLFRNTKSNTGFHPYID